MREILLTSGCGMSQQTFTHWPVWAHFPKLTHKLTHLAMAAPAAGNEYIGRTLKKHIYENDPKKLVVIAQWTSIGKEDIFVEDKKLLKEISGYSERNFINDMDGNTHNKRGFWASSNSNDNRLKQVNNQVHKSRTYKYMRDMEYMLDIQELCKDRNIPYLPILGYTMNWTTMVTTEELTHLYNNIDWLAMVPFSGFSDSMYDQYKNSIYYYRDVQEFDYRYQVPTSAFQYFFYNHHIVGFLDEHFPQINFDNRKLEEFCRKRTEEIYKRCTEKNK